MPTRITQRVIDQVARSPKRLKIYDTQKGLAIRTRAGAAVWYLRFQRDGKEVTHDLGTHRDLSADQARMLAAEAQDFVRRGGAVDGGWISWRRIELGIDEAPVVADEPSGPVLQRIREDFLAWIAVHRRPKTYADYRLTLRQTLLDEIMSTPIERLVREDFAETIAKIAEGGHFRQAEKTGETLSAMWSWSTDDSRIRRYGTTRGMLIGLKPPEVLVTHKPKRRPTPDQVRALLAMRCDMSPTIAAAITLLVYTAQRRYTIVQARRKDFEKVGDQMIWTVPASHLKSKRDHALPIPREAWHLVEAIDEGWLFPSPNSRTGHLSEYTVTHELGDRKVGFSPHDVRRAFTDVARERGFSRAEVKVILDHTEGATGDVTGDHYDLYEDLPLKERMLRIWADAIAQEVKVAEAA